MAKEIQSTLVNLTSVAVTYVGNPDSLRLPLHQEKKPKTQ
jgi:hypothetical protein